VVLPLSRGEAVSSKAIEERLDSAFSVVLRQKLQAPATSVTDFLDSIIENARRWSLDHLLPDLERMRTASARLNVIVRGLVEDPASFHQPEELPEEFYRRVRHDLRTPLNAIKGYSELLIEDMEADGGNRLRDDLKKLKESADQLLRRIESMFSESRHEESADHDGRQQRLVADFLRALRRPDEGDSTKPSTHSSRVLVVDDNASNRDVLTRRLARDGHQVTTATNGPAALELVATHEFDLVLLDLIMPEMSGFEVLRRLKATEHTSRVPVIVISALDELDSVVRCIEAGAEDYLLKPFNPILLRARIGACLEKKWLRDREKQFITDLEEALRQDVAKRRLVEAALHASETQRFLIETERLAALGGLVAGVAHEISGPIGVSLTVASTLANRSASFAEQIAGGPVRRSLLAEFARSCRDATGQLVANLVRAGELVQSFKQVAVDRSEAERRAFELKPATCLND
jgi:DNA-binding response OmpR family regulator